MKSKVLVAIPTMGSLHPNLVASLLHWTKPTKNVERVSYRFSLNVAPVDRARNELVRYFLEDPAVADHTHILFVDSDTVPPPDALEKLIAHDLHMVSGLTPILHFNQKEKTWMTFDNCYTHFDYDEKGERTATHMAERNTGLREIIRCGSSCVLIKREVFSMLTKPYYNFIVNEDNTTHIKSEDINFCDKVREAGVSIFADTDVICRHFKVAEL